MNAPRKVVVVGAGTVGRAVIAELPPEWSVVVVDVDPDALAALPPRNGRVDVCGDATSRLVLERCDLSPSTTVVAVTGDDAVNLEVARVAVDGFGVEELLATLDDPRPARPPIHAIPRGPVIASQVLNRVGIGETRAVSFGLGQGELRQVTVLAGSPVAGRRLSELHAHGWLVAAVYRDGQLIVPHGSTRIEVGDQVILVGEPAELVPIAALFRGGTPTFPAAYGSRLGCVGPEARALADLLVDRLAVREAVDLSPDLLDAGMTPATTLMEQLHHASVGCLVVPPRPVPWLARVGLVNPVAAHQLLAARVPVLVARGGLPDRVIVALGADHDVNVIGGAAIDLARQLGVPLGVLTVLPAHVSTETAGTGDPTRDLLAYARIHGVEPKRILERGNPIERIRATCRPSDLLVLGHGRPRRNSLLTPDVSTFLLHAAPCSTLFVPWERAERSPRAPAAEAAA